jgi:ribose transport system substrate-binding protein
MPRCRRLVPLGLAALSLLALACSSTPPGGSSSGAARGKRFIVLMNNNSPFWDAVGVGVKQAATELGVNAVLETNDGSPQGQLNKLLQYGTQGDVAGVAISVTEADNLAIAEEMKRLRDKGIQVITIDSDVNRDNYPDARSAFVGTNNYQAGVELGKALAGLRPEGGQYVTFVGLTGAQNAVERVSGVKQGAGEKFEARDNMADNVDPTRARQNVRDAMANHPGLNALVGIWSYNAPAIVDVVREKRNRDKFAVAVFDAEPQAIEAMAAGDIDVMVVQNPYEMGYRGVKLLKALAEGDQATVAALFPRLGQPGGDINDTGLKVVVPDGGSPLSAERFGETTQFMKLSEFRDWLEKYDLRGS